MTLLVARAGSAEEADTVLREGADLVEVRILSQAEGLLTAPALIADIRARAAGPSPVIAVVQPSSAAQLEGAVQTVAAAGADYIRFAVPHDENPGPALRRLVERAGASRLILVLTADDEWGPLLAVLAEAGIAGVLLDAREPGARLVETVGIPALSAFVRAASEQGLMSGLAGELEEPDVPRLLQLRPSFLVFDEALRAVPGGDLRPNRVRAIRALMPRAGPQGAPAAGTEKPVAPSIREQRIFVRDLVLPVRIGAYTQEKSAPQKVRFDISVDVQPAPDGAQGMGQVLSYDLITDAIAAIVAEGHIEFAESLAERIGAEVLGHPRARRVTVKVEKLERGPGGVGVEIVMERSGPF